MDGPAYFARTVNYARKMFTELVPVVPFRQSFPPFESQQKGFAHLSSGADTIKLFYARNLFLSTVSYSICHSNEHKHKLQAGLLDFLYSVVPWVGS